MTGGLETRTLLEAMETLPTPYARMARPFWDDAYISLQMLDAHLNPETDAASRRPAFMDRSAAWIASMKPGGALLDLGCGPGLYAERFCLRGLRVTGVDISSRSIGHARASAAEKGLDIRYECLDYRDFQQENAFDIAVMIYCDLGVLPPEDRARLLRRVRRALRPGGLFVFDAWTAAYFINFAEGWQIKSEALGGFWRPGHHAVLTQRVKYPGSLYLERYLVLDEGGVSDYLIWNRAFARQALEADLRDAGFDGVDWFGDARGTPPAQDDEMLCAVAKRA